MRKVGSENTPADILTKPVGCDTLNNHMHKVGL